MDGVDLAFSLEMAALPFTGGVVVRKHGDDVQTESVYVPGVDGLVKGAGQNATNSS